jgi:hypothetical protein
MINDAQNGGTRNNDKRDYCQDCREYEYDERDNGNGAPGVVRDAKFRAASMTTRTVKRAKSTR